MTERQAWLELEKAVTRAGDRIGLCYGLNILGQDIGLTTFYRMRARIAAAVKRHPHNEDGRRGRYGKWGWPPFTPEGQAARVAFCRRQIARIDRAKRRRAK